MFILQSELSPAERHRMCSLAEGLGVCLASQLVREKVLLMSGVKGGNRTGKPWDEFALQRQSANQSNGEPSAHWRTLAVLSSGVPLVATMRCCHTYKRVGLAVSV